MEESSTPKGIRRDVQSYKGPHGMLAFIYHTILADSGITTGRFESLLTRQLAKLKSEWPDTKIQQFRTSLVRELMKAQMSFKTIVRGIRLLGAIRLDMVFRLHYPGNRTTEHTFVFQLDDDLGDDDESSGRNGAANAEPSASDTGSGSVRGKPAATVPKPEPQKPDTDQNAVPGSGSAADVGSPAGSSTG